jgi:Na+-driven multidrug efflux pump
MWSFISQALLDKDIYWIKGLIRKLLLVYFSSLIFLLFLYLCSSALITLWLGFDLESFDIPAVNVSFALGAGVLAWNGIFSTILNGLGQTKVQMYCYLIAAVINIPISYFLCINMGLGIYGVKLGTVCSLLITSIFLPIQVYKLLYVKNVFDKN